VRLGCGFSMSVGCVSLKNFCLIQFFMAMLCFCVVFVLFKRTFFFSIFW
jgi:hypothetical protein